MLKRTTSWTTARGAQIDVVGLQVEGGVAGRSPSEASDQRTMPAREPATLFPRSLLLGVTKPGRQNCQLPKILAQQGIFSSLQMLFFR